MRSYIVELVNQIGLAQNQTDKLKHWTVCFATAWPDFWDQLHSIWWHHWSSSSGGNMVHVHKFDWSGWTWKMDWSSIWFHKNKIRFVGHLRTLIISSLLYQPHSKSLVCVSVLVWVFLRYFTNLSCKDNAQLGTWWQIAGTSVDYLVHRVSTSKKILGKIKMGNQGFGEVRHGLVETTSFILLGHGKVVSTLPFIMEPLGNLETASSLLLAHPS